MSRLLFLARQLPPETAHNLALVTLASGLYPTRKALWYPNLAVNLAGLRLPNPVGLAAGFDKNAQTLPHIFDYGFGFVECGTLTPKAQTGNPKPRVFRLPKEQAVINRLGFNNGGVEQAVPRFQARPASGVVGANIGKNKESEDANADYVMAMQAVYPYVDYITANISSPNTPGLRDLQALEPLKALVTALHDTRQKMIEQGLPRKPIFIKLAPDMDEAQCEALAGLMLDMQVDGLILTNTTLSRPIHWPQAQKELAGGLSGAPLFELSTQMLARFYKLTGGHIPLIGVGGISNAEQAYTKILHGASAVQLYTALIYQGIELIPTLLNGLSQYLQRDGFATISDAVGQAVR